MKKPFLSLVAVSLLTFGFLSCTSSSEGNKTEQNEEKVLYQCPMDCEKGRTYDKPGQCPVCGMDIEKIPVKS